MPAIANKDVARLGAIFERHGKLLYLVGGSVRDLLLGRESHDLDLTTDAVPAEVKKLATEARPAGMYTVGERFGTIGLIFAGEKIEITTFRAEQYEPRSRKPSVTFGTTLVDDLSRRDFTINAIAQDATTGDLIDPFDGTADLRRRVVRAVGVPAERFAEDPLRLLRAVRFAVQLDFDIAPETATAIQATASTLVNISRERIAEEMNRILVSPQPGCGVRLLVDLGLMAFVIPEILEMRAMEQDRYHHKDVFEHTLLVLDRVARDLPLRWAALLHDIAKPRTVSFEDGEVHFWGHEHLGEQMARQILARLRLDSRTVDVVAKLVRMHLRANQYDETWTDGAVRRLVREVGDDLGRLFDLSRADVTSHRPVRVEAALARVDALETHCRELAAQEEIEALQSPLDGNELMTLFGRPPGPWIKPVKDYLLGLVIEGDLAQNEKERAAELARQFMAEHDV
ncbi:MAG: HD domain-containing protein [Chloroflexota bacterium]